jgi:putative serine protease PepD
MSDVTPSDDDERPDADPGDRRDAATGDGPHDGADDGADGTGDGVRYDDAEDTRRLSTADPTVPVTPPHAGPGPGPYPYAMPYAYPAPPVHGRGGRLPGWAWPVLVGLALLAGALGGVVAGVAVSTSMSAAGAGVPYLRTDNGAARPLRADNGSIAAVAARVLPSTVQIQARGGADGNERGGATGSGFVLDDHGHVITNNHVVAGATARGEIKVVDQAGTKHDATIVGRSPVYDLAVLDVDGASGLRPAAIGSARELRVGDTVVAVGSPLGLSSTVTSGIVSALDRPVTTGNGSQSSYIDALQTDAAINPGNSGGPLVNLRGQVVAVNSAIATTGGTLAGESGNIGVGFAIPMEQVRVTAAQILTTGKARYPVIGASVATRSSSNGAQVVGVPAGSPAAAAGLRQGDVVTGVDGHPVTDGISLIVAIRSHQPGETVDLLVRRDGRQRDLKVTLDSKVG